jgi:hypothetical protein
MAVTDGIRGIGAITSGKIDFPVSLLTVGGLIEMGGRGCSPSEVALAGKVACELSVTLSGTPTTLGVVEAEEEEGAGAVVGEGTGMVVGEGTGTVTGELAATPLGITIASNLRCKYAATRACPALSAISIRGMVSAGPESGTEVK